jgi:hypothetical protein
MSLDQCKNRVSENNDQMTTTCDTLRSLRLQTKMGNEGEKNRRVGLSRNSGLVDTIQLANM